MGGRDRRHPDENRDDFAADEDSAHHGRMPNAPCFIHAGLLRFGVELTSVLGYDLPRAEARRGQFLEVVMPTKKRTTHRSSSGKKLYAVRDAKGKFKDIQTHERSSRADQKKKSEEEEKAKRKTRKKKSAK
jgi:hypothetical protein